MRLIAALGLLLLVTQPVFAQVASPPPANNWLASALESVRPQPARPHPAVVRVIAPERDGMSLGSGTLVDVNDTYGLVVTNWHVVRDATGEITIIFPDGFRSGGHVLKTDRDWDLAAVAIWKPRVAPVPLATAAPKPGDSLSIAGYGSGAYRTATGRCTQYVAPALNMPYEMVELSAAARQGDSGGPIFNSQGQLAGVLFGEGHGLTSGSYCGRVHRFLSSITERDLPQVGPQLAQAAPPVQPTFQSTRPQSPATITPPPIAAPLASITPPPATFAANCNDLRPVTPHSWQPVTTDHAGEAKGSVERSVSDHFRWEDFAGKSRGEQAKTALALVGLLALVVHGLRWLKA